MPPTSCRWVWKRTSSHPASVFQQRLGAALSVVLLWCLSTGLISMMLRHISRKSVGLLSHSWLLSGQLGRLAGPEHLWAPVAMSSVIAGVLQAEHIHLDIFQEKLKHLLTKSAVFIFFQRFPGTQELCCSSAGHQCHQGR